MMKQANNEQPILCCIDEVLRGTNTLERIAASSEIMTDLIKSNIFCIVATHDIELAHILEEEYANYHFSEEVINDNVIFDYKLREGITTSRNAIKLLKMLGYPDDIVNKSNRRLDMFLQNRLWEKY